VDEIPVKQKAKRPGVRYFSYLVFFTESAKGKTLFLNKREKDDIWRNMYDFPCIETDSPVGWDELFAMPAIKAMTRGSKPVMLKRSAPVKHVLTHRIIQAVFYEIRLNRSPQGIFQPVSTSEFFNYPIPKLIENFVTGSDIFK
jgi:A/G-specific adenine glycosylase